MKLCCVIELELGRELELELEVNHRSSDVLTIESESVLETDGILDEGDEHPKIDRPITVMSRNGAEIDGRGLISVGMKMMKQQHIEIFLSKSGHVWSG